MKKSHNSKSQLTIRSDASRQKTHNNIIANSIKRVTMSSQIDSQEMKQAQKLSLVHKHITVLDKISMTLGNCSTAIGLRIKTLYLSNNFISNIEHIQQFPNLETLSLSYNQISKITNIRYLSSLVKLSHLSLQGNLIQKSPFYLPYVLGSNAKSNTLKVVDKHTINAQLRRQAIRNWDVYEQSMQELLINYMILVYLMQFSKKEALHRVIRYGGNKLKANAKIINNSYSHISEEEEQLSSAQICQETAVRGTIINSDKSQSEYSNSNQYVNRSVAQNNNLRKRIGFYLNQAELDFHLLPAKFIMKIQDIVYEDANKISTNAVIQIIQMKNKYSSVSNEFIKQQTDGQKYYSKWENKTELQVFVGSMYELAQRQRHKIGQLKQKIFDKFSAPNHEDESHNQFLQTNNKTMQCDQYLNLKQREDVESAFELITFAWHGRSKQIMYYQWKIVAKIFSKLKLHTQLRNRMKYAATTIARVINSEIIQLNFYGLMSLKSSIKRAKLNKAFVLLQRKANTHFKQNIKVFYTNIKRFSQTADYLKNEQIQESEVNEHKLILQKRRLMRKIWKQWVRQHKNYKIQMQNERLKEECQIWCMKEQKLINKIQLLQKLLQKTEMKLKQKQSISNNPKWLLLQLENDCKLNKSKSPSPKAIRKNMVDKADKQNATPNQTLTYQRKFNSSRKRLKIDNQ